MGLENAAGEKEFQEGYVSSFQQLLRGDAIPCHEVGSRNLTRMKCGIENIYLFVWFLFGFWGF